MIALLHYCSLLARQSAQSARDRALLWEVDGNMHVKLAGRSHEPLTVCSPLQLGLRHQALHSVLRHVLSLDFHHFPKSGAALLLTPLDQLNPANRKASEARQVLKGMK